MKAKDIALGGILTALSLIVLYFSSILPINTLAILTIASCIVAIGIMMSSLRLGAIIYCSTSLLGLLFLPVNVLTAYVVLFGCYSIFKYYIEKLHSIPKEIICKLVVFNISFILGFIILRIVGFNIQLLISPLILFLGGQIAFLIYDYALTLLITFYINRIKPSL